MFGKHKRNYAIGPATDFAEHNYRDGTPVYKKAGEIAGCSILGALATLMFCTFLNQSAIVKPPPKGEDAVVLRLGMDCPAIKDKSYAELLNMVLEGEGLPHGISQSIDEAHRYVAELNPNLGNPNTFNGSELLIPDFNGDHRFNEALEACGEVVPLAQVTGAKK